jgi:anti-sigma-K factor RskA
MTAHQSYRDDLPLYAVGALPAEESQVVERHLAECPSCRDELRSLSEAATQIAMAVESVEPAASLREQLVERLHRESVRKADREFIREFDREKASPFARLDGQRSPREATPRRIWFWAPAFAAAVFVFAFAVVWKQNRDFLRDNRELSSRLQANDDALRHANDVIHTLTAQDAERVTLTAAGAKPQPEGKAVYSSRLRSLVLLAGNLNPLPAHKTYELWLLPVTGASPVPAGTFKPDAHGSAALVLSQFSAGIAAKGFAVTIEDEPGASTPTMPIILSGAA